MIVRCWGAHGSIPVSGSGYNRYGGDTTCMEVRSSRGDLIIIDAGSGIRRLGQALLKEGTDKITLLFTHAHLDHLMGFPFFLPLFKSGVAISVRGPKLNKKTFRDVMAHFLDQPYFPVQLEDKDIHSKLTFVDLDTKPFTVGGIKITPIALSHPKNGGLGYKFEEKGKSFVFLTDNELGYVHGGGGTFDDYVEFCKGADLLIHDAEYNAKDYAHIFATSERPWGHSLYTDALRLAAASKVKNLGLFHHNQMRTDTQIDTMVSHCKRLIKKQKSHLSCVAIGTSFEMEL